MSSPTFNLNALKKETKLDNRYERRLARLDADHREVAQIKSVVENAVLNIQSGQKSFVVYGEPQSGKTEMMIALTAKLLDLGMKVVLVLLNDSVQLMSQNLERFQRSGLAPAPKKFSEILPPEISIGDHQWVIFCKKNSKDLQKLLEKIESHPNRVVIDDEADYATPNSKVNRQEKSKINLLTGKLIGTKGIYIGVTATPARLDLNKTHQNQTEHWIDFPPHSKYTGQDKFFPVETTGLQYRLTFLPSTKDDPKYLRDALFSFIVTVAYLNTIVNDSEQNYSILIHTSGKTADHSVDYKSIVKLFEVLKDDSSSSHVSYLKKIWELANSRYPGHADELTKYVLANRDRSNIVVMNSDKEVNAADNRTATVPTTPFTIVIGGNIVSRGVTFDNLVSMFFTRDVKHKLQQDTYIQRARMFGSRGNYLKYFELTIPKQLYLDWQKCFIFHRLSLESRKQHNQSPVWLDGDRVSVASSSSIDKANVLVDKGEMSFALFDFDMAEISMITGAGTGPLEKIKALARLLGDSCLPKYLIDYVEAFCPLGNNRSIAVHNPMSIGGYTDKEGAVDRKSIIRTKGFIGASQMERNKYPLAIHHINVMYNDTGKARVFYKYQGNIKFLTTAKS